jgi:hypothetical protein
MQFVLLANRATTRIRDDDAHVVRAELVDQLRTLRVYRT